MWSRSNYEDEALVSYLCVLLTRKFRLTKTSFTSHFCKSAHACPSTTNQLIGKPLQKILQANPPNQLTWPVDDKATFSYCLTILRSLTLFHCPILGIFVHFYAFSVLVRMAGWTNTGIVWSRFDLLQINASTDISCKDFGSRAAATFACCSGLLGNKKSHSGFQATWQQQQRKDCRGQTSFSAVFEGLWSDPNQNWGSPL